MQPPRFEFHERGSYPSRYSALLTQITEELSLIRVRHDPADDEVFESEHEFPVDNHPAKVTVRVPHSAPWRVEVHPQGERQHKVYTPTDDQHVLIHTVEGGDVVEEHQTQPTPKGVAHLEALHTVLFDFGEAVAEA